MTDVSEHYLRQENRQLRAEVERLRAEQDHYEQEEEILKARIVALEEDLSDAKQRAEARLARVVEAAPDLASEILRHVFPCDFTSVRDYDADRKWIADKVAALAAAQPEEGKQ